MFDLRKFIQNLLLLNKKLIIYTYTFFKKLNKITNKWIF